MKTLEELRNDFKSAFKPKIEDTELGFFAKKAFECFIDTALKTANICTTLDAEIKTRGFGSLIYEIMELEYVICDRLNYDNHYEPDEDDIWSAYENMGDEFIEKAMSDELIYNSFERYDGEECYTCDGCDNDDGCNGREVLNRGEVLEYIKDYYIDEIIEQAKTDYDENNKLAHMLISKLKTERIEIAKVSEYEDYKTKFITSIKELGKKGNVLNAEPTTVTYDFGIFFHFTDMSFLKSVLYPMLSEKKGKSVAVTLKALEQLNIINIDKISRAKLYEVLRKEMNINATDAGINSCLKNEKRGDEIKREVEILKGLLNI